jgi:RHS repeat-associated protein
MTYPLTYDAENRLTAISGAATSAFVYDGDGKRVKTTIGTTPVVTTYFVGNYFEWNSTTSTATKYYFIGGTRFAMQTGTAAPVYLLADHLGSTHVTVYGTTVTTDVYKAWGEDRNPDSTLPTPYRYTGQRDDGGLGGLLFYNSRYYDPSLGRFSQPDTIVPDAGSPMDWDRYAYSSNNPINYNDPTGHMSSAGDGGICPINGRGK